MDERVLLHVRLLMEPLAAVLARIRPSVGVDEQVRRQSGRPLKTFTAYFAVEASFLKCEQRRLQTRAIIRPREASQDAVSTRVTLPESARLCAAPG